MYQSSFAAMYISVSTGATTQLWSDNSFNSVSLNSL